MTGAEFRRDHEQRAAFGAMVAFYPGPVLSFEIRPPYYLASCDRCGWVGSSEACGLDVGGDDSDVYCPRCHAAGADCGRVAALISEPVEAAATRVRQELVDAWAVAWMLKARRRTEEANAAKPVCGKVFMTRATATDAAKRMSNRWRLVEAFPVFAMAGDLDGSVA